MTSRTAPLRRLCATLLVSSVIGVGVVAVPPAASACTVNSIPGSKATSCPSGGTTATKSCRRFIFFRC